MLQGDIPAEIIPHPCAKVITSMIARSRGASLYIVIGHTVLVANPNTANGGQDPTKVGIYEDDIYPQTLKF